MSDWIFFLVVALLALWNWIVMARLSELNQMWLRTHSIASDCESELIQHGAALDGLLAHEQRKARKVKAVLDKAKPKRRG